MKRPIFRIGIVSIITIAAILLAPVVMYLQPNSADEVYIALVTLLGIYIGYELQRSKKR